MQALLFEDTTSQNAVPPLPEEVPSQSIGQFFRRLFEDYCTVIDVYAVNLAALKVHERQDAPCVDYILAVEDLSEYSIADFKVNVANRIRDRLIQHASKTFAPAGVALEIKSSDIDDLDTISRETLQSFDPVAIWAALEGKYGQDAGKEEAWRQVAAKIINEFWLKKGSEVKRKGNYTSLDLRVYIDSIDKKFDKTNRLHYNARQSVSKTCLALASFAQWAGRDLLWIDLKRMADFWWRANGREAIIESHQKNICGDNGEVVMITFTSRFEFRFRSDVAEQLQAFLGTYGVFRDK
ncbi:MAG: hypothetical protein C0402_05490 [Thermodesulfovibrio sp.]|nr:hypothetical protein [Thermodesulfovibrio sp.]